MGKLKKAMLAGTLIAGMIGGIPTNSHAAALGDVNGDGNIDSTDASIIAQIAQYYEYNAQGDVDNNGELNNRDVQLVLRYASGRDVYASLEDVINEMNQNMGDVDKNSEINASDAESIYELIFDDEYEIEADVDGNGEVNKRDAEIVLEYSADVVNGYNKSILEFVEEVKYNTGNLDGNPEIDSPDAAEIGMIIDKFDYEIKADIDGNGEVNKRDKEILSSYATGKGAGENVTLKDFIRNVNRTAGDVNRDGKIDASDASDILIMGKNNEYKIEADVDQNGVINKRDAELALIHASGVGADYDSPIKNTVKKMEKQTGDVNFDGEINIGDVTEIIKKAEAKSTYQIQADIDKNGVVNERDAKILQEYVTEKDAGKIITIQKIINKINKNLGDINKDDDVNSSDTAEILMMISNNEYELEADVDESGIVDKRDAEIVKLYSTLVGATSDCRFSKILTYIQDHKGDLDENEEYEEADISAIKSLEDYELIADLDENGEVNKRDSELLSRYITNMKADSKTTLWGILDKAEENLGDVDGDKEINYLDREEIMALIKYNNYEIEADVDKNGIVNRRDERIIDKYNSNEMANDNSSIRTIVKDAQEKKGDLNGDKKINESDSSDMKTMITKDEYSLEADVDENGYLNNRDLEILNKYVTSIGAVNKIPFKTFIEKINKYIGDIDRNKKIDKLDAEEIQSLINDKEYQIEADVNEDGYLTDKDVNIVLRYAVATESGRDVTLKDIIREIVIESTYKQAPKTPTQNTTEEDKNKETEDTTKEDTTKEDTTKEDTTKEDITKEDSNKETEDTTKEDNTKDTSDSTSKDNAKNTEEISKNNTNDKVEKTVDTKSAKDTTAKTSGTLPKTGLRTWITVLAIITIVGGIISYKKLKEFRNM
ncbi:MAG: hypothetical protein IKF38_04535 [Clostridia bacterium]|nr:hypothetical protein [Clostridia bacterium]